MVNGTIAAADRRPVDPPPVIQLRIFEGPTMEEAKDITNTYLSSFFVYVDLSHSRPVANGRVQTPSAQSPPVLTGSPVSGMCLLDRPAEAGYFLFPDLSVRHEGRYVLGFTLYEEVKQACDEDADTPDEDIGYCFYHRMRVVSRPFHVYSAKKFPGLTQSTDLSRCISEQGCRVRIRRDVRMRRRGEKPGAAADLKEEEPSRSKRTQTPAAPSKHEYRGRSASNSSQQREPYAATERRPSDVDTNATYPHPPPATSSHVRYGSDLSNPPPYGSQYIQPAPQAAPPISPTSAPYSGQPSPYATAPPPQTYPYPSRSAPYAPPTPNEMYDRRSSAATAVPPSPSHSHFAPHDEYRRESVYKPEPGFKQEPDYNRTLEPLRRDSQPLSAGSGTSTPGVVRLPPLTDLAPLGSMPRKSLSGPTFPGINSYPPARPVDFIEPGPPPIPRAPETVRAGSKRQYNETFGDNTRSLYDGQRPQDHHHTLAGRASIYDLGDPECMVYPRADGQLTVKTHQTFYTT